jgi:hypothetical protein
LEWRIDAATKMVHQATIGHMGFFAINHTGAIIRIHVFTSANLFISSNFEDT